MNARLSMWSLFLLLLLLNSCTRHRKLADFPSFIYTIDTIHPATPVKHQGKSSSCWAYSVISFWETEALMMSGDTIHLSPEYIVRNKYLMQFDHYLKTTGKTDICKGGLGHDVINALNVYGIVPWNEYDSCYYNRPNYSDLHKRIRRIARKAVKNPHAKEQYRKELVELLNSVMGSVRDSFNLHNQTFTPYSFTAQLPAKHQKYIELTSFSNYPYHTHCKLDLPDNWSGQSFYNLPLEQLISLMKSALQHGNTFVWHGDVSEPGYSMKEGLAICEPETIVNEETRLSHFLLGKTTDDHMMHVVGLAHNQYGECFFIAKNSAGKQGPHKGYIYLSEQYVRMKTISILMNKKFPDSQKLIYSGNPN